MNFLGLGLLLLIFLSKVSFHFAGLPSHFSVLVFQHGLHPFVNIFLSFLLGLPILFYTLYHHEKINGLARIYRTLLVFLLALLFIQTLLQFFFLESHKGYYGWIALLSTYWIIILFGVFLPSILEPYATMKFLSTWSLIFVTLSLVLLVLRPDLTFKGGRFIGIFKHIPYMVTCASVGTIFTLGRLQYEKGPLAGVLYVIGIFLCLFALALTGTRSALAAVVMAVVLWILRAQTLSAGLRFLKYSAALVLTVTALLFGNQIISYVKDVATGKRALADRGAQDGVASRLEEVERGWEYFQTSPWIGQGLLSKFSGKENLEVSSYNSFKDPHNIFVSAGVVGGWPFIIWTAVFLLLLIALCVRAIMSEHAVMHIFGIYGIVQIPILIIYHWHLSLGGMADRLYWLVFGYLAMRTTSRSRG